MFIELFYYIKVVFIIVIDLHILKFFEQVSFHIKKCVIIFSFNSLSQLFKDYIMKFFFAIKCTGNHKLQKVNKVDSNDLFDIFIVTVFK